MKKLFILLVLTIVSFSTVLNAQAWEEAIQARKGELNVYYFENEPYAYTAKNGKLAGIEIDIIKAFVEWVSDEKGIELKLNFKAYKEFDQFYYGVLKAPTNSIGLGSVTITKDREEEVQFSAPYLKNVSVLVTDGSVPTARSAEALQYMILNVKPVTIKGSVHQNHLDKLYEGSVAKGQYDYVSGADMILSKIKESPRHFGYVDVISFWKYIKTNKHYIKMHTIANKENEEFGFIHPKHSDWSIIVNEFFESGFGFTATKAYHRILEDHLSFEILERVEID